MTSVTWVLQYRMLPQDEIVPQAVQPAAKVATGPELFGYYNGEVCRRLNRAAGCPACGKRRDWDRYLWVLHSEVCCRTQSCRRLSGLRQRSRPGPSSLGITMAKFAADWTVCGTITVQDTFTFPGTFTLQDMFTIERTVRRDHIIRSDPMQLRGCRSAIIHEVSWRAKQSL
jgi:hypothetical protein